MWITLFIIHFARKTENNNLFKLTDRLRLIVRIFTNVLNHRSRASCRKNSYSQPVPILPTACQLFLNKVIHISSS